MKEELQKTIMASVEANLPQATAESLVKLLNEREDALKRVAHLEQENSEFKDAIRVVSATNAELSKYRNIESRLNEDRLKLEEQLRDFRVDKAEFRLEEAEKRAAMAERLTETVFKNKHLVHSSFTNGMMPVSEGGFVSQQPYSHTTINSTDE